MGVCTHECVYFMRDIHGLVYLASVLSSKDTGESSIVGPEFSCYPFNSGRAHQRRGLREYRIHAHTHKTIKNATLYVHTHKHTSQGDVTLPVRVEECTHTQKEYSCVCVCYKHNLCNSSPFCLQQHFEQIGLSLSLRPHCVI